MKKQRKVIKQSIARLEKTSEKQISKQRLKSLKGGNPTQIPNLDIVEEEGEM